MLVYNMDELRIRNTMRLKGADYNQNQAVFLTICTKEKACILSRIVVGTGEDAGPYGTKFCGSAVCIDIQKIL